MKTINVLIAGAERRASNIVQSVILDVCYNRAAVNFVHTARVDELQSLGSRDGFEFVVVNTAHLMAEPSRRGGQVRRDEILRAIGFIRCTRTVPVLAFGCAPEEEPLFQEAGASAVLGRMWERETLAAEVRQLLQMPAVAEPQEAPVRGLFSAILGRGLNLLKNA